MKELYEKNLELERRITDLADREIDEEVFEFKRDVQKQRTSAFGEPRET